MKSKLLWCCAPFAALLLLVAAWRWFPAPTPEVSAATAQSVPALPVADIARLEKCRSALDAAPRGAVVSYTVDRDGYGRVVVGPEFMLAPYDDKESVNQMVLCIFAEGRRTADGIHYVEYLDSLNHKEFARWSDVTGFAVDD